MATTFPHLPLGPLPLEAHGKRRFRTWVPYEKKVELLIDRDGNKEVHQLEKDEWGYRTSDPIPAAAGLRYGFYLEGDHDKVYPDPASRYQPEGVHELSEVVDFGGAYSVDGVGAPPIRVGARVFSGHAMADAMIYELHIGTFTPEGTFDGAVARLDYLQDLGINTVELMPLNQTPGDRNWGYDGVALYAVFQAYGGPEGLKRFLVAAHERGIAVLIDVIYNHLGPEGNYLPQFFPIFTEQHKTPWGPAINLDGEHADGVRNFLLQNVRMWLDDYGADGLRIDAVHALKDYGAEHFLASLSEIADQIAIRDDRRIILLAECDLNAPRYLRPRAENGYGLSGQWVDEFHHALHALLTSETLGYYEDFGSIDHLARALKHGYVYTGQYSPHRKRNFGTPPAAAGLHPGQFAVFLQNHDQVGNRMIGDRLITNVSRDKYLLGAGTYLLSPFVPLIFQGEEYGETKPFPYFVHHGEGHLIEAVRKGRAAEFAAFQRPGHTVPDPQSEETFNSAVLGWEVDDAIHSFYKKALLLRPRPKPFSEITVLKKGKLLIWGYEGTDLLCLGNYSDGGTSLEIKGEVVLASNGAEITGKTLRIPGWGFCAVRLADGDYKF